MRSELSRNVLLNVITNCIDAYTEIISELLVDISGNNLEPKYRLTTECLLETLKRFNANSIVIKNTLLLFKQNVSLMHPIGLLIRSSFLDFITVLYLNSQNKDYLIMDKAWVELQLERIYCDQLGTMLTEFNILYEGSKLNDMKNLLKSRFPDFFEENTYNLHHKGRLRTREMILNIKNNSYTKQFVVVYEKWVILSKYEHYGAITYELQKIKEKDVIPENARNILMIIEGIIMCIRMLPQMNNKINYDTIDIITNRLVSIKKQYISFLLRINVLTF